MLSQYSFSYNEGRTRAFELKSHRAEDFFGIYIRLTYKIRKRANHFNAKWSGRLICIKCSHFNDSIIYCDRRSNTPCHDFPQMYYAFKYTS